MTMTRTRRNAGLAVLQYSKQTPQPGFITQAQVLELPDVMQRYLRYAGVVEKEPIHTVRLKQQGFMRTQPDQKWIPLVAEQYFTTTPPAFVWNCTMRPFPLAWISVTDLFTGGHGRMIIKLLSFITVGNAHGPEIDQGELQRYLAEMICMLRKSFVKDASNVLSWFAMSITMIYEQCLHRCSILRTKCEGKVGNLSILYADVIV
jgi:hypothetical protein